MSRTLDSRYQHKPNRRSRSHAQGYEPGSAMAALSVEERKAVQARMQKARRDDEVFCRQLEAQR